MHRVFVWVCIYNNICIWVFETGSQAYETWTNRGLMISVALAL